MHRLLAVFGYAEEANYAGMLIHAGADFATRVPFDPKLFQEGCCAFLLPSREDAVVAHYLLIVLRDLVRAVYYGGCTGTMQYYNATAQV